MRDYIKLKNRTARIKQNSFSTGLDFYRDESVMKPQIASDCANFEFNDGCLSQSWGVEEGSIFDAVAIWDFTRFDSAENRYITVTMFMKADGSVCYRDDQGLETQLGGVAFTTPPITVNYRLYDEDVIIMCSPTDHMVVWNGIDDAYTVPMSPFISSMAMHYERLFVTSEGEKNAVWFSDDLDPTNWNRELDEGGYIQLIDDRGRCNKVIDFLNYIYIFRDNGISRLTAYADQSEFFVSNLFVSSGKIFPETVTLCGDRIYFLASDGLYLFDGLSTGRIFEELGPNLIGDKACGAYYDGKYFLALRLKTRDEELSEDNNALIVVGHEGYSVVKGLNIVRLCPTKEGLYAVLADGRCGLMNKNGALFDEPLPKFWITPDSDLGYDGLKILNEVCLSASDELSVTVKSDFGEKTLTVHAGDQKVYVNLMGHYFKIIIQSQAKLISVKRFSFTYKR